MTGLNVESDRIIEIACVITDGDLNIIAEGPDIAIKQSDSILDNMNEWCIKTHGETGLTEKCRKSTISEKQAEEEIFNFIKQYAEERMSPLAGNSVYVDRTFLKKYMPTIDEFLHYRIIDVSTVKELCNRWNREIYTEAPKKKFTHRALDDIIESIGELKYYKSFMFKK